MPATDPLREAIALSAEALGDDAGGPFGAVVVLGGRTVGRGRNRVLADHDPTAHAEVVAIRDACRSLGTHDLAGATVYASCEPCPMCQGAILWSRAGGLVFAATREDAAEIGFHDARFHDVVATPGGVLRVERRLREEARDVMRRWAARPGRRLY